jgi:hypothetical protein
MSLLSLHLGGFGLSHFPSVFLGPRVKLLGHFSSTATPRSAGQHFPNCGFFCWASGALMVMLLDHIVFLGLTGKILLLSLTAFLLWLQSPSVKAVEKPVATEPKLELKSSLTWILSIWSENHHMMLNFAFKRCWSDVENARRHQAKVAQTMSLVFAMWSKESILMLNASMKRWKAAVETMNSVERAARETRARVAVHCMLALSSMSGKQTRLQSSHGIFAVEILLRERRA